MLMEKWARASRREAEEAEEAGGVGADTGFGSALQKLKIYLFHIYSATHIRIRIQWAGLGWAGDEGEEGEEGEEAVRADAVVPHKALQNLKHSQGTGWFRVVYFSLALQILNIRRRGCSL